MKSNAVLIQQASGEHMQMLRLTYHLHSLYCERHGIDYWAFFGEPVDLEGRAPNWCRVKLMQMAQVAGYQFIIWLDADCLIVGDTDLREACVEPGFNMTWCDMSAWKSEALYDHWNTGAIYFNARLPSESKSLLHFWWHESDKGHGWADQHAFNLAANKHLISAPHALDRKWNSIYPEFLSPEPVVMAWHGYGDTALRCAAMAEEIHKRFGFPWPTQVTETTPGDRRVHAASMLDAGHLHYARKEVEAIAVGGARDMDRPPDLVTIDDPVRDSGFTEEAQWAVRAFAERQRAKITAITVLGESLSDFQARSDRFVKAMETKGPDQEGELRAILTESPDEPEVLRELGKIIGLRGDLDEAEKLLNASCAYDSKDGSTWNALGAIAAGRGDYDRAGFCYDQALHFSPDMPMAHRNRALNRLMLGDYGGGFEEDYQWGRVAKQRRLRFPAETEWTGNEILDGTLLVWCDQGAGDVLMNLRFLRQLRECVPEMKIVLEIHDGLVGIAQSTGLADTVIKLQLDGGMPIPFDAHVELGDLPHFIGVTSPDECTITEPYIVADPVKVGQWREKVSGPGLKVGLVWKGNPQHPNDKNRSMQLEQMIPLIAIEGLVGRVSLYALQVGDGGLSKTCSYMYRLPIRSWDDTAAIIENLDVVVTVDTGVVHLAGAMGARVIVLLPIGGDWRWGPEGDATHWYPSMTLVRQTVRGSWAEPVAQVAAALEQMVGGRK